MPQMGSGNCGNPAQCRNGRDATARRRVTRALAETAETPNRAFAASAKGPRTAGTRHDLSTPEP